MVKHASAVLLLIGFVAVSCAFDLAHVSSTPTQFTPQIEARKSFVIKDAVQISQAPCGYERTLRQGTNWNLVGTIPEGEVYKPKDQVLTVECSNVFEAYLVVSKDSLVGFYLPVEREFVSIAEKIELPVN
ncbi:MAG: hypothetical protein ACE5E2_02465 [Candidatus Binatia bacterium]